MVYCGPPSKGCQKCRQRKIRCDQRPEGCVKCEHINQKCPGYRDQLDLMFRNENHTVEARAKAKSAVARTVSQSSSQVARVILESPKSLSNIVNINPSNNEKAMGYFFTTYVTNFSSKHTGNYDIQGSLLHSMRAVGLAGIMASYNAPSLKIHVTREYMEAVRLTNGALNSPSEAKKDSTLLGVIILGIFEVITRRSARSFVAWENHLKGAAALIKLRGIEQMRTADGRRLFLHVTSLLVNNCVRYRTALPEPISELKAEAEKYVDQNSRTWHLHVACLDFIDFRTKLHCKDFASPSEIIAEASRQNQNLISIFSDVPPDWKYSIVETNANPDLVFQGRYHIYPNQTLANLWNSMRYIRFLLHVVMLDALSHGIQSNPPVFSPDYHDNLVKSLCSTIRELQADILSSFPQRIFEKGEKCISQQPTNPWSDFEHLNQDPFECSYSYNKMLLPDIRLFGCYGFVFSIWAIGQSYHTAPDVRQWIIGILRRVASIMNIREATSFVDTIQEKIG